MEKEMQPPRTATGPVARLLFDSQASERRQRRLSLSDRELRIIPLLLNGIGRFNTDVPSVPGA
ncbi:hypothetical protein DENIS_0027 [Desulfonema ishimotonii]|uniref:Uncharacterized protein n=1 Tax=Desulfonema ishimotonii TaxID=45657 RepID=A0A401FQ51_9BACT|nr:hypothetical protein DENIS_0027 [Desulfonema ishimotonii]